MLMQQQHLQQQQWQALSHLGGQGTGLPHPNLVYGAQGAAGREVVPPVALFMNHGIWGQAIHMGPQAVRPDAEPSDIAEVVAQLSNGLSIK